MADLTTIPLKTIAGESASLGAFAGKVVLAVNVASQCGLTPQYEGLEQLYRDYREQGLVVAGFPSNDFGGQEPGDEDEIATFCTTNFGVDFPMFEKIVVSGPDKHPLYAALTEALSLGEAGEPLREKFRGFGMTPNEDPEVLWNFEKFVIGKDGTVAGRFSPATEPTDPALLAKIAEELAK
jgi:glutathione peroxidase